jgi:hypothetical protein
MQKFLLLIAVTIGLVIAYIDSSPGWDDTGITVFALLAASFVIGLVIKRRPWLFVLAIGLWIPLWEGLASHNPTAIITIVFPLIGVYAGWLFRQFVIDRVRSK